MRAELLWLDWLWEDGRERPAAQRPAEDPQELSELRELREDPREEPEEPQEEPEEPQKLEWLEEE